MADNRIYSKRYLAEQAWRLIQGGDISNDSSIIRGELVAYVGQVVNELIKTDILLNKSIGENVYFGDFISIFECLDILKDEKRCVFYTDLPARPLGIPNNSAITEVYFNEDPLATFMPIGAGFNSLTFGLDIYDMEGEISYWLEGRNRIYFKGITETKSNALNVHMIADARSLNENEFLPIAPEFEPTVIQRVVELYRIQKATNEDRIKDGVDPSTAG